MRAVALTIAYDGTGLAGWQRQAGFASVQQHLEEAVLALTGEPAVVHGSGRTDAGVHALAQVAHFRTDSAIADDRMVHGLNAHLPRAVSVLSAHTAPDAFHARFSAIGKRYLYRMVLGPVRPALARHYAHWIPVPVALSRMRDAARYLLGEHDFSAFASSGSTPPRSAVRRIDRLRLWQRRQRLELVIQGNGFLYNMVRTIAGSLVEVGRGKFEPAWLGAVMASRDRRLAGPTAPACGLYLLRVLYPPAYRHLVGC
jgi:tRNA pseudouridine38-40 synthase